MDLLPSATRATLFSVADKCEAQSSASRQRSKALLANNRVGGLATQLKQRRISSSASCVLWPQRKHVTACLCFKYRARNLVFYRSITTFIKRIHLAGEIFKFFFYQHQLRRRQLCCKHRYMSGKVIVMFTT